MFYSLQSKNAHQNIFNQKQAEKRFSILSIIMRNLNSSNKKRVYVPTGELIFLQVKRNSMTFIIFHLPAQPHTIILSYSYYMSFLKAACWPKLIYGLLQLSIIFRYVFGSFINFAILNGALTPYLATLLKARKCLRIS